MAEILKFKSGGGGGPTNILRKVPPGWPKNADVRSREHHLWVTLDNYDGQEKRANTPCDAEGFGLGLGRG